VPTGKFVQWFLESLEAHAVNLLEAVRGDEATAELAVAVPSMESVAGSPVQSTPQGIGSAVGARLDIAAV